MLHVTQWQKKKGQERKRGISGSSAISEAEKDFVHLHAQKKPWRWEKEKKEA